MEQRPIRDAGDQWLAAWERRDGRPVEALIEEFLGPGDPDLMGADLGPPPPARDADDSPLPEAGW